MTEMGVSPMSEEKFRQLNKFHRPQRPSKWARLKQSATCSRVTPSQYLPILSWIRGYSLSFFLGDLTAGLTALLLQIPPALAFAPLGGQAPVVGLYMAIFPPLAYVIFGTSRHLSLGIFAILVMMVGKVVEDNAATHSATEVCIAVSFLIGAFHFLFGIFRLGFVFVLLSDNLVSGFTCGAAVHILFIQFKFLLGINPPGRSGPLKLIYNSIEIAKHIPETNLVAMAISLVAITILGSFNEFAKPRIAKRTKFPVPADFLVIVIVTMLSYFLDLNGNYGVEVVGDIPTGLPTVVVPPFSLMPTIAATCLVLAFVNASVNISLSSLYAKKGGYVLDKNQELLAYGLTNIFGSFLQSLPVCGSIARTNIQFSVGGKTQIASLISSLMGLSLLLFAGKVLELLPLCVLAAVAFVALKGILMQAKDLPRIWRRGRYDGFVWVITFVSVVIIDVDYGLAIGLAFSIFSLVIRGTQTQILVLGKIPNQDYYVDRTYYETQSTVLILKLVGSINFANSHSVMLKITKEFEKYCVLDKPAAETFILLDFGAVTSMDANGVEELSNLNKDLLLQNCQVLLTNCSYNVYQCLERCDFFKGFPKKFVIVSIEEALCYLEKIKVI